MLNILLWVIGYLAMGSGLNFILSVLGQLDIDNDDSFGLMFAIVLLWPLFGFIFFPAFLGKLVSNKLNEIKTREERNKEMMNGIADRIKWQK